ncbi:MAG: hypothetical protein ACLFV6_00010 [Spirulinaceae cyanobacterium]
MNSSSKPPGSETPSCLAERSLSWSIGHGEEISPSLNRLRFDGGAVSAVRWAGSPT